MTVLQHAFLVVGRTGEYEDVQEWNVAVYLTKEEATQHCTLANEYANKCFDAWQRGWEYSLKSPLPNPYDVNIKVDFPGVSYRVEDIPLVSHVDQYREWMGTEE